MNLDDNSLLSAYLDGVLSASEQAQVEAALVSSQELRSQLESLAETQRIVRGLSQPPAPQDSSTLVAAHASEWLKTNRHQTWGFIPKEWQPWVVLGPLSAAAAVLLGFWISWTYDPAHNQQAGGPVGPVVARSEPVATPALATVVRRTEPIDALALAEVPTKAIQTLTLQPVPPGIVGVGVLKHRPSMADDRFSEFTKSPMIAGLTISAPALDADLLERIDGVIHRSPRVARVHALFSSLPPGLMEPDERGTCLVYALTLEKIEYERLRQNLANVLTDTAAVLTTSEKRETQPRWLSLAAVQFDEVEPIGTMVPYSPSTPAVLQADKSASFQGAIPAPNPNSEPINLILESLMLGDHPEDHSAYRPWLFNLLGMNSAKPADMHHSTPSVYLIKIIER